MDARARVRVRRWGDGSRRRRRRTRVKRARLLKRANIISVVVSIPYVCDDGFFIMKDRFCFSPRRNDFLNSCTLCAKTTAFSLHSLRINTHHTPRKPRATIARQCTVFVVLVFLVAPPRSSWKRKKSYLPRCEHIHKSTFLPFFAFGSHTLSARRRAWRTRARGGWRRRRCRRR